MYVTNLTTGAVLLPNGRDLITWLEVDSNEVEMLRKYEGTLLTISSAKPKDVKVVPKELPIEAPMEAEGTTDLAEALKPTVQEEPVQVQPIQDEVSQEVVVEKKIKKSGR